jgi:hypothetical protein
MLDWFLETGIYLLGIVLIPVIGLLLLCWGVRGDRSKGRSRCPQCWYDMRGSLPRLECPECGHDAEQRRQLYRTRRGRRRIAVGVVLVVLSSYPLAIVGAWCRDQASMSRLVKGRDRWATGFSLERVGPAWLVTRLPEGFARLFDRVEIVKLVESATDPELTSCGKLLHLRELLVLGGPEVTDVGLKHLERLAQIEHVKLWGTQVTDVGVARLSRALPNADISVSISSGNASSWGTIIRQAPLHWPPPGSPDP